MEPVENLMITITAYLVLSINESVMDIALRYKFRHQSPVLRKNGLKTLQLRTLLTINPHPISLLDPGSYILRKKFKILIEYRLWLNTESHSTFILTRQRQLHIYITESAKSGEEIPVLVHIRRIKPYQGIRRKHIKNARFLPFLNFSAYIRIYLHRINLILG